MANNIQDIAERKEQFFLECKLKSTKNQEFIRNTLLSKICNNACVDSSIKELVEKYSIDSTLKSMSMVSINDKFQMGISQNDYDLVFRFLIMSNDLAQEEGKKLNASLSICDPLPFTKFFIDIDCKICHNAKKPKANFTSKWTYMNHVDDVEKQGKQFVNHISSTIRTLFSKDIPFIVATKSTNAWCGIHLYFLVNLDVVMKKLIFNRLLTLNQEAYMHHLDITMNGILPLCRDYNLFFDSNFKQISPNIELLHQVSILE